jgi:tetratricopeptide (TPR) repeat protein
MPARRVETWTEYWYPVRGLHGGFVDANNKLALNAVYEQGAVKLIVSPVVDISGATIVAKVGSKRLRTFPNLHFSPLQPSAFTLPVRNLDAAPKGLDVEIRSSQGRVLLHWSAEQPLDGNPDFVPKAGTRLREPIPHTPQTPLEQLYLHGLFVEKQGKLQAALKIYREILARDSGDIPALRKEAQYAYLAADLQKAESFISRALARNDEDPATQYLAGVIDRAVGRLTLAEDAFWKSIHYGGRPAPAFAELGEIAIRQKEYAKAAALLRRALSYNRGDALALADLAVAERLAGHIAAAQKASAQALQKMPLLPYALAEQWQDTGASSKDWTRIVGIDPQNYVAIAAWYRDLGDSSSSEAVLRLAMQSLPAKQIPAMAYYDLSAKAQSCDSFFPNRVSDALVLKQAITRNPGDSCAQYAIGNFLFAHARYKEAASLWSKALNAPSRDSKGAAPAPVLLRNLGVYAWRIEKDLPSAASFYARAIRLEPADYRVYTDLDEIYAQTGNASARAKLFANAPAEVTNRDTVRTRYVLFLIEQSKFNEALSELSAHEFKPWEGAVGIHNLFVVANMGKGYAALRRHSPDEAAQDFRQAMQYPQNLGVGKPDTPEQSQQLYGLGIALAAEGKPAEAQTVWKRAAKNVKDADGLSAIYSALALKRVGKSAQAQQILEHCIEEAKQPNAHANAYFVAGLAERHGGNAENARRDFQRALQLDPSFWQARMALSGSEVF